jgi:hypothetical protein
MSIQSATSQSPAAAISHKFANITRHLGEPAKLCGRSFKAVANTVRSLLAAVQAVSSIRSNASCNVQLLRVRVLAGHGVEPKFALSSALYPNHLQTCEGRCDALAKIKADLSYIADTYVEPLPPITLIDNGGNIPHRQWPAHVPLNSFGTPGVLPPIEQPLWVPSYLQTVPSSHPELSNHG